MYLIKLPLAYFLSINLHWGVTGIWVAIVVSYLFNAGALIFWFMRGKWKTKKI